MSGSIANRGEQLYREAMSFPYREDDAFANLKNEIQEKDQIIQKEDVIIAKHWFWLFW